MAADAVIVGGGEIGSAFAARYALHGLGVAIHDPPKGRTVDVSAYPIAHICVPADVVSLAALGTAEDALVIVHSTTLPGTCARIPRTRLVHAPVEGRHPNIAEALTRWRMPVSGPKAAVQDAALVLAGLGIPAMEWPGPHATTEVAKHLSTLRLGVEVAFMREAVRLCRALDVDHGRAYGDWTRAYNDLYAGTDFPRSLLAPTPGVSPSHCVGPNARALAAWLTTRCEEAALNGADQREARLLGLCEDVVASQAEDFQPDKA